jgi:hypothetical protein
MVNYRIMKHLISKILTLTIDCILVFRIGTVRVQPFSETRQIGSINKL